MNRLQPIIVRVLAGILLLAAVGGCRETAEPAPDGAAYFPLRVGDEWVYEVLQETFSATSPAVVRRYQVRERLGGTVNQGGQESFLVEESVKTPERPTWELRGVRTVYRSLAEAVRVEGAVPRRLMAFPVTPDAAWNLNAYAAGADTLLRYERVGQPFGAGGRAFDRTVSVVGKNDSTLVDQTRYLRVYADGLGLVYRQDAALQFCQSSPDCIGKGRIESGTRQTWVLLSSNRLP